MDAGVELEKVSDAYHPEFLMASADAELMERTKPALAEVGRVQALVTAEALLESVAAAPHAWVALDTRLPGMEMGQLLASVRALLSGSVSRIVLFSDIVTEEWRERLREGSISDVVRH